MCAVTGEAHGVTTERGGDQCVSEKREAVISYERRRSGNWSWVCACVPWLARSVSPGRARGSGRQAGRLCERESSEREREKGRKRERNSKWETRNKGMGKCVFVCGCCCCCYLATHTCARVRVCELKKNHHQMPRQQQPRERALPRARAYKKSTLGPRPVTATSALVE